MKKQGNGMMRRLAGAGCALALAASMAAAPMAFADGEAPENPAGTSVTTDEKTVSVETPSHATELNVKPYDGNVHFTMPTNISFGAEKNGVLKAPAAASVKIQNLSAYQAKVSNLKVAATRDEGEPAFTFVENASVTTTPNAVDMKVKAYRGNNNDAINGGGLDLSSATANGQDLTGWYFFATGNDNGDALTLAFSGKIANLNKSIESAKHFADLTWTVAIDGDSHATGA